MVEKSIYMNLQMTIFDILEWTIKKPTTNVSKTVGNKNIIMTRKVQFIECR